MKFAAHCDLLVLGVGDTENAAYLDAEAHGAEPEFCDIVSITAEAADYVEAGGDCRGLILGEDDVFRLNPHAPPRPHFGG